VQSADRYVVRPATGAPDRWDVWDTVRDEPVFGAQALPEENARELARRLNEAYRRWTHQWSGLARDYKSRQTVVFWMKDFFNVTAQ